jgi:thioredoxin-related protein
LPHLQKLWDKYRDKDFSMIAINTEPQQDEIIPEWKAKGKYTFPVLVTEKEEFARTTYSVTGTPTNILLNTDGKVVFRHIGYYSAGEKILEAEIRELLGLDPFEGVEAPEKSATGSKSP